jgi:hypothetical protein
MAVWSCPSCGRTVPGRIEVCHCGMSRARALGEGDRPPPQAPVGRPGLWRSGAGAPAGPTRPAPPSSRRPPPRMLPRPTARPGSRAATPRRRFWPFRSRSAAPPRRRIGPPWTAALPELSWHFWAWVAALIVALVVGAWRVTRPYQPIQVVPLLSYQGTERKPPPMPTARPERRRR